MAQIVDIFEKHHRFLTFLGEFVEDEWCFRDVTERSGVEDLVSGVRILGNPIAGFRAEGLWEGANFVNFLEESERERLELKERMKKEREERGLL